MATVARSQMAVCVTLTQAISRARTVDDIYGIALDALAQGLSVARASILLFDPDGVMRFKAHRGLSQQYRQAVEGHTPWTPDTPDPEPIVVGDVARDESLDPYRAVIDAEGIAAMAFIPLVSLGRVIGKFMLYYDAPRDLTADELLLARVVASQVAFAVERTRAEMAAEEASRLKDEFLATLSHELRTPLNAILGWVHMLQGGQLAHERARQAIDIIGRNARLQAQLIEDILDVSRIITGKLEVDRLPVLVPQLLETVVHGALPGAEARRVTVSCTIDRELPPIEGDPKRLHQVLANVLSNALKFTPDGGTVAVRCVLDGDSVVIEIRDSGVGIAPEFLPYVFDRFRQADSGSTRQHGGLGLGLAIARHLVEQHHGEIQARSEGAGHGTAITIRLPAGPLAHATHAAAADVRAMPETLPFRLDGATVLVVDDQRDSRELLGMLFEAWGADVLQCESASSALDALRTATVHLLVADIAMPEIDGYELIRRVRAIPLGLPAVAVSAYARPQDRINALVAGFNGYCAKPIETDGLLQTVRQVMLHS
jgi:signal transduction histidine kinase/CheY-like chemotaxis protein